MLVLPGTLLSGALLRGVERFSIALLGPAFAAHTWAGAELPLACRLSMFGRGTTAGHPSFDESFGQTAEEQLPHALPAMIPRRSAAFTVGASLKLHPSAHLFAPIPAKNRDRNGVRPVSPSGDALPIGASAVCSLVRIDQVGEVSLLSGEIALPATAISGFS
jgi:hypothetical protein